MYANIKHLDGELTVMHCFAIPCVSLVGINIDMAVAVAQGYNTRIALIDFL